MIDPRIISPADQKVGFVELFFDLVFVFSVTQVVGLLHHEPAATAIFQAVLVFFLVWWAWSQFTWALNAANTEYPGIAVSTLVATGTAFFMAVALPQSYGQRALWFAVTYVIVRLIGLAIYAWVAWANPGQRGAVRLWILVSLGGLAAVLAGGFLGGAAQYWLWSAAILLDVAAAIYAGRAEGWDIHPEHFSERHALFVIIALGESLIVAAGAASHASWSTPLALMALLSVAVTCALWWSYFTRAKPLLDSAAESSHGRERTELLRDIFSLFHFLMVCGIIAFAFAVESAVAHPAEPLLLGGRVALAAGIVLFVGGMALAIWRATRRWLLPRIIVTLVAGGAIILLSGLPALVSMAVAGIALLTIAIIEQSNPQLDTRATGSVQRDHH